MNLPDGVVGVVGAEEDEEEATAAAAALGAGGTGLDSGLTMAAAPSVDPIVVGPICQAALTSAKSHFEAAKIMNRSLLAIPVMVLSRRSSLSRFLPLCFSEILRRHIFFFTLLVSSSVCVCTAYIDRKLCWHGEVGDILLMG